MSTLEYCLNSTQRALERDLPPQISAAVLDAVPHGLIVFNPDREIVFANTAGLTALGSAGGNSIDDLGSIFCLIDPVTEKPVAPEMTPVAQALAGRVAENREYIVRRSQGGRNAWIECGASPIRDANNLVTGAVFTFRDITERKQHELDLEASTQLRDFIYHENLAGIIHSTVDGRIIDCNDAVLRMLGYSAKPELLALRSQQLYCSTADREKLLVELSSPGTVTEHEIALRCKDGSRCWVLLNVRVLDARPGEVGGSMVSTLIDITQRRAWEEDLRRSEQRFAAFMRHLPGVAFIKDPEGRYVFYNESSVRLFGKQPSEMVGKTDDQLWQPDHAAMYRENDASVIADRRHYECLETVEHNDGTHTWLIYKFPIIENGEVVLVGGVGIDVTERQILEQQLMQSRKMDALGLLAGGVAHDFNNLLTVISGYGQLAIEALGDDPEPRLADYLTRMLDGARRATGITGQLLAFSRREVIKPVVLDLADLLTGMERLLRTMVGDHIRLRLRQSDVPCMVLSDEHQMQQVIINLAVNARDAMPLGGELEMRCETLAEPIERAGEAALNVLLEVRDNGIGMDEATLNRIFDPFFTSKEKGKGTGLGLSTVYGIVSQAKGRIDVESVVGEGTTFRLYFPGGKGPAAAVAAPQKQTTHQGRERVLLVEDEPWVRSLAKSVLLKFGYKVMEAESGSEALDVWEAQKGKFDILLSDVVMPGMSGGDLAMKLRERDPRLKVLFMSGYAGDMLSRCGVLEGQTQLLPKPFTPEALGKKLRAVLDA